MALNPGSLDNYEGSMALAIEKAFEEIWIAEMKIEAPPVMKETRILYAAIAQGVIKYLREHPEALK